MNGIWSGILVVLTLMSISDIGITDDHAIYISVVEVTQDPNDLRQMNVLVKVFKDDLEDALQDYTGNRMTISDTISDSQDLEVIESFFNKSISISVNDSLSRKLALQHTEVSEMSLWLSFTSACSAKWTSFDIEANYFMDLFPDQTHIVNLRGQSTFNVVRLTKSMPNIHIDI